MKITDIEEVEGVRNRVKCDKEMVERGAWVMTMGERYLQQTKRRRRNDIFQ